MIVNLFAVIGMLAIVFIFFIVVNSGVFSKEWWDTPPDPNDMFGVNIRTDYQTLKKFFTRDK